MTLKILLLNVHSDRNAGDLALSRVTIQQLEENFPDSHISLSMNDPSSYEGDLPALESFFPWVMQGNRWHYHRLLWLIPATLIPIFFQRFFKKAVYRLTPREIQPLVQAYVDADLIISTAGGFYRTSGKGLTLLITSYSLLLALFSGKPLYIFPQSIGPFKFWWECPLARWIFSRARIVMTREPISVKNLTDCGLPRSKILLLPDVAFGFNGATREEARRWIINLGVDPLQDRPFLGMTIIDWQAFNPEFSRQKIYEDAIDALIRLFIEKFQGKVFLLPQTWGPTPAEDDRIASQRIADRIPQHKKSIYVIDQPLSPDLLQAVFGEMDLVVGTRMHSNIFSISRGVPVIPIGYLHKSLGIAEMAGLEDWVIDIEHVNATNLCEKLLKLWNEKEVVRGYLKQKTPALIQESQKAGQLVAEDYANIQNRR